MTQLPAQEHLFKYIRQLLPESTSLAETISGMLYLSNDSAYRRIRGETPLTLDETKTLCRHFCISIDQLLSLNNHSVLFENHRVNTAGYDFEQFLDGLQSQLNYIQQFNQHSIIYLTKDVTLFQSFYYKPLFAFRYFFWMKSVICHPAFANRLFDMDCLPGPIEQKGLALCNTYNALHSDEIWNTECVNSILIQLEFYREAGYIDTGNAILVYTALIETIEHLQKQSEAGIKFTPGENPDVKKINFRLFHNTMVIGDNTIFVQCGAHRFVYLNYDVLNYMQTSDNGFCTDTYEMLQNLMRRSTLISSANEKNRYRFFNILLEKVRERIRKLSH